MRIHRSSIESSHKLRFGEDLESGVSEVDAGESCESRRSTGDGVGKEGFGGCPS